MSVKALARKELCAALVVRQASDHKGLYGHVLVAAGSRGMAGAAILAARGALRSGAGLVSAAVPYGVANAVAGAVPAALTLALPDNQAGTFRPEGVERLRQYVRERRVSALAIGPGVSTHPDAARFVWHALSGVAVPAVVDADALNALAQQDPAATSSMLKTRRHPCVFTPHTAEASRLLRADKAQLESERVKTVERIARDWGGVALLKGHRSLVSSGVRTALNPTGGPGLAKGGSGDVLTGLIAGLWAQMLASGRATGDLAFQAAALGAWLHGTAGELAQEQLSPWAMTPDDIVERLPAAFKALCA